MTCEEIEISTDPARIDLDTVHTFLSTSSYWAQGRTRAAVEGCIRNSLCFGGYHLGRQVAFGRVITDFTVFAYLADIFVVAEYRGRGIGKTLLRAMVSHPQLQDVRQMLLRTRDAHGLYGQFGFRELDRPEEMMARISQA